MFQAVAEKKGLGVFFADALRTHGATAGRGAPNPEGGGVPLPAGATNGAQPRKKTPIPISRAQRERL